VNPLSLLEIEALVWILAHTPEITCEQLGIDRTDLADKLTEKHFSGRMAREIKTERASRNGKRRIHAARAEEVAT
jgi:hypothetical protein